MDRHLFVVALMAAAIGITLLPGCAAKEPGYDPMERRPICHLRFHSPEWYGQQLDLAIWNAYEHHIGMHPNDYWGFCKPEDLRDIPPHPKLGEAEKTKEAGPMGARRGKKREP